MEKCWFCKKVDASSGAAKIVKMYGEVKRGDVNNYLVVKTKSVQFQTCEISIPRCTACKNKETRSTQNDLLVLLCCLGIAYLVISYGFGVSGWLSYGLIVALGVGLYFLSALVLPSQPSVAGGNSDDYPPIRKLTQQGWYVGDRPTRGY
jgi:hypothetical protein